MYEEEFNNFKMIVKMEAKSHVLPEVTIVENAPQLAYKNKEVWVLDYSVDEKGIMAVTTDGKESNLLHLGFEQDTISIKKIDKKLDNLFRDILYQDLFGNTHLMSLDSAFQVYSEKDNLELLYGVTLEKHKSTFGNIYALTDSIIVTRKEFYSGQEVVYFMTNRNNGRTEVLCDVYGSSLQMAKNWHIDNIRLKRVTAYDNEITANHPNYERPMERDDFEADMIKRLMLQEIYVPLLNVDDKIYIFDFQKDYVYKYDNEGKYLGNYIGGFIYGDTGYAVLGRPITQQLTSVGFSFRPYVTAAKCVGNGKFETYGDINGYDDESDVPDHFIKSEIDYENEVNYNNFIYQIISDRF